MAFTTAVVDARIERAPVVLRCRPSASRPIRQCLIDPTFDVQSKRISLTEGPVLTRTTLRELRIDAGKLGFMRSGWTVHENRSIHNGSNPLASGLQIRHLRPIRGRGNESFLCPFNRHYNGRLCGTLSEVWVRSAQCCGSIRLAVLSRKPTASARSCYVCLVNHGTDVTDHFWGSHLETRWVLRPTLRASHCPEF